MYTPALPSRDYHLARLDRVVGKFTFRFVAFFPDVTFVSNFTCVLSFLAVLVLGLLDLSIDSVLLCNVVGILSRLTKRTNIAFLSLSSTQLHPAFYMSDTNVSLPVYDSTQAILVLVAIFS